MSKVAGFYKELRKPKEPQPVPVDILGDMFRRYFRALKDMGMTWAYVEQRLKQTTPGYCKNKLCRGAEKFPVTDLADWAIAMEIPEEVVGEAVTEYIRQRRKAAQ